MRNPFADDPHQNWRRWGERDPYYAVLLDPRHRRSAISNIALDALYDSGERYGAWLEAEFDRLAPNRHRQNVLDFGCGVGRITLALARRYQAAIGVDIAPGMLREAERQASQRSIANTHFTESLAGIEPVDAICAFSVLQHMAQPQAEATLQALVALLRPGGVGAVHILIGDRRSRWRKLYNTVERQLPIVRWPLNLLRRRPLFDPPVQMNVHSLAAMTGVLQGAGLQTQIADALGSPAGLIGVEILFHRKA